MRYILIVTCVLAAGTAGATSIVLNGDFENHSAASTMFNMSNSAFTSTVDDATAFGTAEEIDLVTGTDFFIAPWSGDWKLGLHHQGIAGMIDRPDAFSLDLAMPVAAGGRYRLEFFAAALRVPFGTAEVGLSSSATDFGTPLFSGIPTSTTEWTRFVHEFTAGAGAAYLTFKTQAVEDGYVFLDAVSLEVIPEPSTAILLALGGFGLIAVARRRRRA